MRVRYNVVCHAKWYFEKTASSGVIMSHQMMFLVIISICGLIKVIYYTRNKPTTT